MSTVRQKERNDTYVLGNTLSAMLPLEAPPFSTDALERLERLFAEETVGIFGAVVGKEVVGEKICRSVDREVCKRTGPVASVRCDGVLVARAAERMHDGQVVSIGALGHRDQLLELRDIKIDWVAAGEY